MRVLRKIRGPGLGTKLALMGLALLLIPLFSYRQLVEMERLLFQSQSRAQLLTAQGISTLFNGREDLFEELPLDIDDFEPLYAQPIDSPINLDGVFDDWQDSISKKVNSFGDSNNSFELVLGERADFLYAFITIRDNSIVHRDPNYLRLDNADHLRLSFVRPDGRDGRVAIIFPQSGEIEGFEMDDQWRYAATGAADNRIQGSLRKISGSNSTLEFRFPLSMLGSSQYFGISYVDVDDPVTREIENITQTLPSSGKDNFDLVVLGTPEVRNIVQSLGYSGSKITVIDSKRRIRAENERALNTNSSEISEPLFDVLGLVRDLRIWFNAGKQEGSSKTTESDLKISNQKIIDRSLTGEALTSRKQIADQKEVIVAAHPIVSDSNVIGTVIVEQNTDDILSFQRSSLEEVLLLSLATLGAVFIALIGFAGRLAWRIRKLRREASEAIDNHGRLKTAELKREINSGDEIGDLSRSVSAVLEKLHQHNQFLQNMPRTLRHEINNPLNTLSTSLQNLVRENPDLSQNRYLESAQRGVDRIGSIIQDLADAANLEDSLSGDDLELIDINDLLENYISNYSLLHQKQKIKFLGPQKPVMALVSDFRIEQLLDKIVDNAIDFHRSGTSIIVSLEVDYDQLQIVVANRGPTMTEKLRRTVFDSMVSHRSNQNRLHFGLGLYVARVIAEHHSGYVRALNLSDNSGVAIEIRLPLASVEQEAVSEQI